MKKYLPLYYEWIKQGEIPYKQTLKTCGGLCSIFPGNKLLTLCLPENGWSGYYGFTHEDYIMVGGPETAFTPLRQNILLFMAAMNQEL